MPFSKNKHKNCFSEKSKHVDQGQKLFDRTQKKMIKINEAQNKK
jgi:hypothetical protein